MTGQAQGRAGLKDEQRRQFAGLILLDRVSTVERAYHAGLLEHEDDELLEPVFKYLLDEHLAEIGDDDYYRATERGHKAYQTLLHQQQSYLTHYDVYARVDLAEGEFWNPEGDDPDDPRWVDLRVAVAEYKGIDPYRMVFLAMLAEERFFENPEWKFDLALGSTFFTELEQVVAEQVRVDDLAYEAEDGSWIPGTAVIEDVILQGARLNRERLEQRRQQAAAEQQSMFETPDGGTRAGAGPDDGYFVMMPYDPWAPMAAYAASAMFAEALWLGSFW